jgi:peptidyl-prolyl cis-trans isomerase D
MFDFVRKHNRLFLGLILLLILPSFVVFGIQGYSGMTEGANASVAKVDGQKITQAEWDASHQQQAQRVRQQRPEIDPKLLDAPEARAQTLDALVRERVLAVASDKLHLTVSPERLQRLFVTDPQFAMLRNADNSINKDLIAAQGMSVAAFEQRLRQDLTIQQVQGGITGSVLVATAPVNQALDALLQRREIQLHRFDAPTTWPRWPPPTPTSRPSTRQNEALFRAPEQASIEYVVLDLAVLKIGATWPCPRKTCASTTTRTPAATRRPKSAAPATS